MKKEPINARTSASIGFFTLRIPLPRRLPITESIIIARRRKRRLVNPAPVPPVRTESTGKVMAPARDKRNSNTMITTAFNAKDPKFMISPMRWK
jgi:hypothetical protein